MCKILSYILSGLGGKPDIVPEPEPDPEKENSFTKVTQIFEHGILFIYLVPIIFNFIDIYIYFLLSRLLYL